MSINRRDFLKYSTFGVVSIAAVGGLTQWAGGLFENMTGTYVYPGRPETWPGVEIKYSTCKQCHSDCGIMARLFKGNILKLDGNPYDPQTTQPHIDYDTPFKEAKVYVGGTFDTSKPYVDGAHSLCARGQAGRQTVYDPYRVYMPLKRVGERGSKKFKVISYEQLIDEVVNGGNLFKDVKGEESRSVEGFKHIWNNGQNRYTPANPEYPDFGPKTNQYVSYWGRAEGGQGNFITRFANALGSVNAMPHVSICDLTHHVATFRTFPGTNMLKPDQPNCDFLLIFGANYYEANFPMQTLARRSAEATASGKKIVFIDPRGGNQIAHADYVPIKPGGDGAFAMAMIRWILENKRYNEKYLELPNYNAAARNIEPNYSNASYLVVAEENHPDFGLFLKPDKGPLYKASDQYVIDKVSKAPAFASATERAELWPTGFLSTKPVIVNGVACLTSLQYLWKEVSSHDYEEYEKEAGISKNLIKDLAKQFTSHGRKAAADFYRGPAMHANGYYNARAVALLNGLIGNIDWKGGYINGGGNADFMTNRYDLNKWPDFVPASGVKISREGSFYEDTDEYKNRIAKGVSPFPAQRPWFPFGVGIWQEIWGGVYFQYPYETKILFQHNANPAYTMPGMGGANDESLMWIRMIKDLKKVPLFIASDIMISESSAYADYIVPDGSYIEGWGMLPGYPTYPTSRIAVRRPIIEPVTQKTKDGRPICMENFLIDVAKTLNLPGFGKNAFLEGGDLNEREDIYLKMVANIAYDSKHLLKKVGNKFVVQGPVPDAPASEMKVVGDYMKKHPKALKGEEWKKAAYVVSRGGRFENCDVGYLPWGQPEWVTHRWGELKNAVQIYDELVAKTHNAITGVRFNGSIKLEGPKNMKGELLYKIYSRKDYPFMLSTNRLPIHSKSKTMSDPWLIELLPGNFIEISEFDGNRLGVKDGDLIKVSSPTHTKGIVHRAKIRFALRPGVVSFSIPFGRWLYGSGTWYINGKKYDGDSARNSGVNLNPLQLLDESIAAKDGWTVVVANDVSGGMSHYSTPVRIEKV
ncbi:MAG: molybdopterin dinucleotide-binding protein [Candidatus Acididesulfobacter guangdongensis]|uniref:Molybdopterin dinucleotide-binding protein n=1 Tax=Acididesulfobacter guangdongensis TaxID=2597225 RepID=A0A519BEP4_ACIG2|nr:MAG: molybdopterin dinucleotide-binding protein [Candidatus Acididesulfobacter guangdongensis]